MKLNTQKTALTVGLFLGLWHLIWSVLVAAGVGQAIIDFIFWAHMIHVQYIVGPFDITASLILIVLTFVGGYIIGLIFAWLWNWLHKNG